MFTPTQGVPAAPPAYGLVASAVRPTIDRWENGLAWVPERCGATYQLVPLCDAPAAGYEADRPGAAYYQPVGHRVADECSTMGGRPDLDRARRVAEATGPFAIARELWAGDLTKVDGYEIGGQTRHNAYLASSAADVVGVGAGGPLGALGQLEAAALDASGGQPIMLHLPVAASWLVAAALFRVGQALYTAAGNLVVVDGAYPGTGPAGQAAGATVWAYATSPVAVLTSPWEFVTDDPSTVDRDINTRTTWAQRVFAATFDPCVHLATEIILGDN